MKAFCRYVLFFVSTIVFVLICRLAKLIPQRQYALPHRQVYEFDYIGQLNKLQSYYAIQDIIGHKKDIDIDEDNDFLSAGQDVKTSGVKDVRKHECRMGTCFDFERCKLYGQNARIYVYPIDEERVSETFLKIVNIVRASKYYEPDPDKACLFISDMDTLDRDPLSQNFHKFGSKMNLLHQGRNHIMFNLYSGTWPNYIETDFSGIPYPDYSILAKASMSHQNYRKGFDISLPLFSPQHPVNGPDYLLQDLSDSRHFENFRPEVLSKSDDRSKKYLLSFKGKRYVYGIGSETRNSLFHLHNGRDVLFYTTCKHGKKWKENQDSRCEIDNSEYDKHDYQSLMDNSTFCLVPRGRRMGSFRFLEALQKGCIPVIMSNSWKLPFSEVIDWSKASITLDERLLFQIAEQIRSIPSLTIETMRAQCVYLYNTYFASLERIITTTITIIEDRIDMYWARESFLWNVPNQSPLGPLWIDYSYSTDLDDFPGFSVPGARTNKGFAAMVTVSRTISFARMIKFVTKSLMKANNCQQIIILWTLPTRVPAELSTALGEGIISYEADKRFENTHRRVLDVQVIEMPGTNESQHNRFLLGSNRSLILTDAVFQLDPESNLMASELDFAYGVWLSFPERVVGFTGRDHHFDSSSNQWTYTSKWTNEFSIVMLDGAIYHRYYNYLYAQHILNNDALRTVKGDDECSDIAFNFLISHMTRSAAVKVTQRKSTVHPDSLASNSWKSFLERKVCFHKLMQLFGYIPLIKSRARLEPLLYKDAVSSAHKKYSQIESLL